MLPKNRVRGVSAGFTLIELLVVVAIIALLISILLPSLHRAKRQARQLVCVTNLRSQGEAARFYAEENEDHFPRGIQGLDLRYEYHIYATCLPKYLGWTGEAALQIGEQTWKVSDDQNKLWNQNRPGVPPARVLNGVMRKLPQLQCPDYPEHVDQDAEQPGTNPVDYVASTMPIPYTQLNIDYDAGGMVWDPEGEMDGVPVGAADYIATSKLDKFPADANPAGLIYVTEAHTSLPWRGGGPRFHHFFLAQQLPFGGFPRIANDQRHPNGITALFWDGHAAAMDLHQIDAGYPHSHAKRLKLFTVMPDDYVE